MTTAARPTTLLVLALLMTIVSAPAQEVMVSAEDYLEPPRDITDIITSDALHGRKRLGNLGPDGEHFIAPRSGGMPPLSVLARPYVNLGETAIDHGANRSRRLTLNGTVGYEIISGRTGASRPLHVPAGLTVSGATWSPDGSLVAFAGHAEDASHLYVAETATGEVRRVCDRPLLMTLVSSAQWTSDGDELFAVFVPADRRPMPERGPVRQEPGVFVAQEGETPSRTYRFLLRTPHDKLLLEYLTTGQLAFVSVETGELTPVGDPAMITSFDPAPDGSALRVTTMQKPFSYFVPRRSFGTREELWDRSGKVLQKISERKLRNGRSPSRGRGRGRGGDGPGDDRRQLGWRPDGQGLSFLQREPRKKDEKESKDGKDAKPDAPAGKKDPDAPAKKADDAPKKDTDAPGKGDAPTKDAGAGKKGDAPLKKDAATRGKRDDRPTSRRGDRRGRPRGARARRGGRRGRGGEAASRPDGGKKPERKDRVMQWLPPYDDESVKVVWESEEPIQRVQYSQDCRKLFITQRKDGKTHVFAVDLDEPDKRLKIREEGDEDGGGRGRFRRFGRGRGGLMTKRGERGGRVVRTSTDGRFVFFTGTERPEDPMKEAPRPWVERVEIGTGEKERIWQSAEDVYETLVAPLDDDLTTVVIERQSPTLMPDTWVKDVAGGEMRRLTHNVDPAPEVTAARRERFQVTRVDGFRFWVDVTIPRDHGEKLPAIFWFYPREYTDQKSYDRSARRHNKNRFPLVRTRSMELLTLHGYVVVNPDCPIVGEQGRMNDNYVCDLRNNLWAVIDELDKRRIIDRDRLAIGGHSYGAFSTANALVHTPFFKAGIAGDGNYNRTLTPMSFQRERRHLWDARETYVTMSPLLWADQVNGALLMYHGMDDTNSGTFPINSPRMFQALDGLGKPAALYMYPYEGHGPRARETILDLWARWVHWLDIHVKHPDRAKEMYAEPDAPDPGEGGRR